MESSTKLYLSVGILAALGVGLYVQKQGQKKEAASYTLEAKLAQLPTISVAEEVRNAIDSIEILRAPKEDKKDDADKSEGSEDKKADAPREKIVLKKSGEDWELQEPVKYKANGTNVKSLLDNLKSLKVSEQISESKDAYAKWGVTDEKALHAVFKKGDEKVLDIYFGENGSRGQMTRVAGKEGVFAVKGYSKYLYDRDTKGWRDKTIVKFDEKQAEKVTIENENGSFVFSKEGDSWKSEHKGKKGSAKAIKDFKASKVDDLLRAYKSLNASDFSDGKPLSDLGLDEPSATVTIELTGDNGKVVLHVGDSSEGSSRWVKSNKSEQVYSISSWSADWATADVDKFQEAKKDGKKEDKSHAH